MMYNICHTSGGVKSDQSAFGHSVPLVTRRSAFSHIRNIETPWACGPDVGLNTCNEMNEKAACRRYSCLLRPARRPRERKHGATSSSHTYVLLGAGPQSLTPSKVAFETHIRGITTHQNRAFPMKTLDSTSTRSRHKRNHGTSKPAISRVDAGFHKHQLETQVASQHIKTSHPPCRRSIPQALVGDTHAWHHCALAESPVARWIDAIPQAPVRDTRCITEQQNQPFPL